MSARGFHWLESIFCVALALATAAVYHGVFSSDFIRFDDPRYVTQNAHVRGGLTLDGIAWAFTAFFKSNWHPLTWLSHMLDVELFGLDPAGHHATNLLLHVANSLLLFAVLRAATREPGPSAVVAALFALHPTHVESVAWVAERKDVLSTLFWLLATASYLATVCRGGATRWTATALLLLLGLSAKPMLVSVPLTFLLLDYWPLGRLRFDRSALRLVVEKLPLLVVAAAFAAVTFAAQSVSGAVALGNPVPFGLRCANAVMSYGLYLGKTVWPADLALLYPHPYLPGGTPWPAWQVAATAAGLLAASAVFLRARNRPYLAVGWLWFLGTLVPVIGLLQVGTQGMADRYTYVPCIGLYVMAAWGGADLARWLARRWPAPGVRRALVAGAGLALLGVLVALAGASHRQVAYWRDTVPLLEHSLAVAPGAAFLHNNLANELFDRGRLDDSIRHHRRAVEIMPAESLFHRNLSHGLRKRGELYEATRHDLLGRNIALDSAAGEAGLGRARLREEDVEAALEHFQRALAIDPEHLDTLLAAGDAELQRGSAEVAIGFYQRAVASHPDSDAAHRTLAEALLRGGDLAAGVRELREVVRLRPSSATDLTALGTGLRALGDLDGAIVAYRRAVEASPGAAVFHLNLGDALLQRGELEEASVFYRQAVVIAPDAPETRQRLEYARRLEAQGVRDLQSAEADAAAGPR
jgi:tetratricopeptide (TPR) repeat protein